MNFKHSIFTISMIAILVPQFSESQERDHLDTIRKAQSEVLAIELIKDQQIDFYENLRSSYQRYSIRSDLSIEESKSIDSAIEMLASARVDAWAAIEEGQKELQSEIELAIRNAETDRQRAEFSRRARRSSQNIDLILNVTNQVIGVASAYNSYVKAEQLERHLSEIIKESDAADVATSQQNARMPAQITTDSESTIVDKFLDPYNSDYTAWFELIGERYHESMRDSCLTEEMEWWNTAYPAYAERSPHMRGEKYARWTVFTMIHINCSKASPSPTLAPRYGLGGSAENRID